MNQQFQQFDSALDKLESLISALAAEKEQLKREAAELRGIIDDRDLEILQLQEDAQKKSLETDNEKKEIESRLKGLQGRLSSITPDEKKEDSLSIG